MRTRYKWLVALSYKAICLSDLDAIAADLWRPAAKLPYICHR